MWRVDGFTHMPLATSTGSIFTWGAGGRFRTGRGQHSSTYVLKPKLLQDLSSKGVVGVSATNDRMACFTKASW